MASVWDKLNLKSHQQIVVLNTPESFEQAIAALHDVDVRRNFDLEHIQFVLSFVTKQTEVDSLTTALVPKLQGDAIVWFAYPKGTSKRYRCEFNRDTGWAALGKAGFETVRQVAIDEDWSALRFRRVEHVKKMIRNGSRALTNQNTSRTSMAHEEETSDDK